MDDDRTYVPRRPPPGVGFSLHQYLYESAGMGAKPDQDLVSSVSRTVQACQRSGDAVHAIGQGLVDELRRRRRDSAVTGTTNVDLLIEEILNDLQREPTKMPPQETFERVDDRFRVLLMGRTQAGKSTLLEYLTGGDGSRIGDGRQRFSRDVVERPVRGLDGVLLIDTPGVGARDGERDYNLAFSRVPSADLVLWVTSNDPLQEQATRALRVIAALGKPMILVVNCHVRLDEPLMLEEFLDDPYWAYQDAEDHYELVRKRLAEVGATPVAEVAIHADAAFRSMSEPEGGRLLAHSRINRLIELLTSEQRSLQPQRQSLRLVDSVRVPAELARARLQGAAATLERAAASTRAETLDMQVRSGRKLDEAEERLLGKVIGIVAGRRHWHLDIDPDKDLQRAWESEQNKMREELTELLKSESHEIHTTLRNLAESVLEEWADLPGSQDFSDLPDFGSVFANRAARFGAHLGVAATSAGVGGMVGGPVGLVVGGILGFGLGFVQAPITRFIDEMFHGKDEVLRRRRAKVEEQIKPILDAIAERSEESARSLVEAYRDRVSRVHQQQAAELDRADELVDSWREECHEMSFAIRSLDVSTGIALVRLASGGQIDPEVTDAMRVPGLGVATQLSSDTFNELAIFPPKTAERVVALPPTAGPRSAAQAGHFIIGLTEEPFTVRNVSDVQATVEFEQVRVPRGVTALWAEFASAALFSRITIKSGDDVP